MNTERQKAEARFVRNLAVAHESERDDRAENQETKVGVLELARQLGNVSQACRIMGERRDGFYRCRERHDTGGEEA